MFDTVYTRIWIVAGALLFFSTTSISAPLPVINTDYREPVSLETCIQVALQNNHRRPASRYAVEMAEAQHRQALAGYWPQITAKGGYQRMDESSNFLFPEKSISLPGGGIPLPPALGGGFFQSTTLLFQNRMSS
ncbi:hypothetical protein A7E78_06930 [Syntrophotalea acetylenivorans]|uniref:Uncharacterized protein n=1 Tax=Syntrophotalea acetylenivorans TaxID=1842532 RepID=A0A1L3GNU9_9BACT|nr:TolC family protein [Syntrophotalea acetylenivorans]APG27592.1 hypothetical protein A7E78_06930 [Syntrophotalea acetylenivorans]